MIQGFIVAALAVGAAALSVGRAETRDLYTIETAPGVIQTVTEAEKWNLKAVGIDLSPLKTSKLSWFRKGYDYSTSLPTKSCMKFLSLQLQKG